MAPHHWPFRPVPQECADGHTIIISSSAWKRPSKTIKNSGDNNNNKGRVRHELDCHAFAWLQIDPAVGWHLDKCARYYLWIHGPDAGLANASIVSAQEGL